MNIKTGLWQKLSKLFGGDLVYQTRDEWGEMLVVDYPDTRVLTFDCIHEQSRTDLANPHILQHEYTRAMMLALLFRRPAHVTLLGLGGGCVVRGLHHVCPDTFIHVIELREQVARIARTYFGLQEHAGLKITLEDAQSALPKVPAQSTNLILADMFAAWGMNPLQQELAFLQECHRILDADGWLVINYHQLPALDSPFFSTLNQLFAQIQICPLARGNCLLYAGKHPLEQDREALAAKAPELSRQLGFDLTPFANQLIRLRLRPAPDQAPTST